MQAIKILFLPLIPSLICLGLMIAVLSTVLMWRKVKVRNRQSPLTSRLLRSPGYALIQQIDEVNLEINAWLMVIYAMPTMIYAIHLTQTVYGGVPETSTRMVINAALALAVLIVAAVKLATYMDKRSRLQEGFEAESAVGAELNQLMLDGAHVFHDVPAEGFNVDHVIVSPKGVYAVETKSRAKYLKRGAKTNVNVLFDGRAIKFPSHQETAPVGQASSNAKWLGTWLSQAVGEPITPRPVLALPGWFVRTTAKTDLILINGKGCRKFFDATNAHQDLSESQIQRIVHQIDQRCRDIEPTRYEASRSKSSPISKS